MNYSSTRPTYFKSERQKYYGVRKTCIIKKLLKTRYLYKVGSPTPLRVVAKEEKFDLFERFNTEGVKHLGRDRLFVELKEHYAGFSRDIMAFIKSCSECHLQKNKKPL